MLVFSAASANPNVKVNAVYEPFMTLDYIVNQLQYDSIHQRFNGTTNSFHVIARQQLAVVKFIVFSVSSYEGAIGGISAAQRRESVVQPALPTSITSSIRMARRKTWPEGVAERRGRKTCLPDRGLFLMAEFLFESPRLAMMPNHESKEDTDGRYTF